MPILFQISIETNSGSVGRIAEHIGQIAIAHGWESYITYARNHLPSKSKTIKIGTKWDVYWHGIITRIFDRHCLASTKATKKLIKQIEEIRPDIIQLHHIHGYYINMKILFNYLSSINTPVVWIFHDCWSITGHCAHFDYVNCDLWKTQCHNCVQKKEYPKSIFKDRSTANFNLKKQLFTSVPNMTIVTVSNWLSNIVKESFLKNYPTIIIPNGIDTYIFSPSVDILQIKKALSHRNNIFLLGVASNWNIRKGLYDFYKLNSIIPNNWKIILVGLSSKQLETIPKGIIGIRRTENIEQLVDLYTNADVFINPTYEDTFPTTNIEALACGTPVITYRTGGSIESISEDTGFIIEKGDIEGIKKNIEKILLTGKTKYTSACRKRAIEYYDKNDRFEDYIKLYNRLIVENNSK